MEDGNGDRADLGRRRVLICVSCNLLSQAEVDIYQLVVPRVAGPHGCEDLPNGTKLLFRRPFLDMDSS